MRRALGLVAGAAVLLAVFGDAAHGDRAAAWPAQGSDEVPVSWAVGPTPLDVEPARANYELEAEPGDTVDDVLVVENLGQVNLVLGVYASDAFNTESGGIDLLSGDDEPTGLGSWVVVDEPSVTVPAGARVEVPFSIRVPDDATPGDHAGGIVTSLRITEPDQAGTRVTVERRLGTRIYLRVDGELRPELTFTALSSAYRATANPFAPGAMDVTYRVENTGNVRLRAARSARVDPSIGPSSSADAADMAELLPGNSYELTQRVDGVWPGWSTATEVELTPYDSSASDTVGIAPAAIGRVSTTLVPWPQIVLLAAAVALAVLYVLGRRRRDRQLRAAVDKAVDRAVAAATSSDLSPTDLDNKEHTTMSRPTTRQRGLVAAGTLALAFVASACFPQDPPVTTPPTTAPECVPAPATVTNGAATLTVSQVTCLEVGDVITVTGSGYTTTGNVGTRPPFPGRPSGVYVVHGEFADPWRPSAGVNSGGRTVLTQYWAVPEPTYTENTNQQAPYAPMDASGGFSVTVTVAEPTGTNPTLGIATYPGSGATNADEEILIPLTLDPAA